MPSMDIPGGAPPPILLPTNGEVSGTTQSFVQKKSKLDMNNSHFSSLWSKQMEAMDLKRRYKRVSVMIIHWKKEEGVKDDEGQAEINRLRHVFETKYNYEVHEMLLGQDKKGRSTQSFINKELSNFVYEQDDEQTLVIVYAAGHGIPVNKTGQLVLAGECEPVAASRVFNSIVWNQAEMLVRSAAHADMFLILDCCHAGRLLQARNKFSLTSRIFEFLGACGSEQTTPLPGRYSFTSALIWALEKFAEEGTPFFSAELREKIVEYEHMSKKQDICLSPRGFQSYRKLILEPLSGAQEQIEVPSGATSKFFDESNEVTDVKYGLNLQFLLPEMPDEAEIKQLSESLKQLIMSRETLSKQVLWKGLICLEEPKKTPYEMMQYVVNAWQNKVRRRKGSSVSSQGPRNLEDISQPAFLDVKHFPMGLASPGTSNHASDIDD